SKVDREYGVIKKHVSGHQIRRFERKSLGVVYSPDVPLNNGQTNVYLRGVKFAEAPIRNYPKGPLMAHVVGYANHEGVGSAGIEQRMDEFLRGKDGLRVSKKDGRRREIYSAREVDRPPEDGATVVLTLDQWLQYQVEKVVEQTYVEFNAKAVWAIVQNVRTGEILAMASFPTYDLNRFQKAPPEWQRNRAISVNYEPGSTMKAAVVAAALDQGIVKPDDVFFCEKGYWGEFAKLKDSHPEEDLTVSEIIKVSSNIGTAKIAVQMGKQRVYDSILAFGFKSKLGVGLPGEERGILDPPSKWSKQRVTRVPIGQGVAATALQVVSMMSAIAYNGVQMKPYIVKEVVKPDGTVLLENKPEELGRPIRPAAARQMQQMLALVTEEGGTGTKAALEGYRVAGKTGTAQKVKPTGGYYEKNFVSSFAGFLPVNNPQVAIIVVADDPGSYNERGRKIKYFGGTVCGPAFSEIARKTVDYLRIAPDGNRIYVARPDE
ncbi:MAG: penicillin-binding protein 2, partial [Kiritimatiellaceae bacterium]|nr:penicillin-binding protein 2 [Kiritimatiellaceae bacterium]